MAGPELVEDIANNRGAEAAVDELEPVGIRHCGRGQVATRVPFPPERAAPPIIVAAIASNSRPFAMVLLPDCTCALKRRPLIAAAVAASAMTRILTRRTLIPERFAALMFPPTA